MKEKQFLPPEYIMDRLNDHYGIAVTVLTLLPLGADIHASVYKAETNNGASYFLKLKQGHHDDISVILLALLRESGIQEIIPSIKTVRGELAQHVDGFTLIVYPFVEGQNGFCYNLSDDQWITLGKVLRQVHAFDVPPSLKVRIREERYSSKWREAVRTIYAHIDKNPAVDDTADRLQTFMKERQALIQRLVDRAEALSQKIKERYPPPACVLCHADIHGGNVLIDRAGALHIVDWDQPVMAPKERDLMFIGGGVANIWNNPHEEAFFYKGYGKTAIDKTILSYYRQERIVEDIAVYGQALLLTASGAEDRFEMYTQFLNMFAPRGVVDIACKTDELV